MNLTPEEAEFYPTPAWCVRRILDERVVSGGLGEGIWLEPCVGEGAIVDAADAWLKSSAPSARITWSTHDIRDTEAASNVGDFLLFEPMITYDGCIMNPPFSKALRFVQKALAHCGTVIMLQRLNWLQQGSTHPERSAWLRANTPSVYVLPDRPSFTGKGTDGGGYAWYVWDGREPTVEILFSTPDAERKADEAAAQINRYRGPEQLTLDS